MTAVRWYDQIAKVLDPALLDRLFYRAARREAIDRLALSGGEVVADLFCGSGVNFPYLQERLGTTGTVIGVDGSPAMLRRARIAADVGSDRALPVVLVQADFSTEIGIARVRDLISRLEPTHFLFTLGLTCLPNWREFFRSVYDAAPDGARFAILDVHCERPGVGARLIQWTAAADCTHEVWRELKEQAADFALRTFSPFRVIDARVIVASGTKAR